ncbi:hypothetical protein BX600DRAFT_227139 [Xylariales sp. PMI_506]|nr:hypothetical protein BX600DRAFT_227139 [Xylariales sp. PMI_506]
MGDNLGEGSVFVTSPAFHIDLAALDACHPVHYSRRLLLFRCASPEQYATQLAALTTGLKALVARFAVLGGTIAPLPADEAAAAHAPPEWRTILPGPGLELITRDLRQEMPSLAELEAGGFQFSQLPYDLLVPVPQDIGTDRPYAACKVQFSAIDGGSILAFAMSHSVADGSGTNEMLRVLSEQTRTAQHQPVSRGEGDHGDLAFSPAQMGLDRSPLRDIKSEREFLIDEHPGYMWVSPGMNGGTTTPARRHPFEATEPEIPVTIHIPTDHLAQLKLDATPPRAPGEPPISTHDALTALIWRSILLIRSRRHAQADAAEQAFQLPSTGTVFMPSDARRHLGLPSSYVGNAVYQLAATIDLDTLLSPSSPSSSSSISGLRAAARAIRRAITAVNPALVSSYMAMVNKKWVDWRFMESYPTTGVAMGTDWSSGELYGHDWGAAFGPLVRYRFPNEAFNCILPKLPDGSTELSLSVMPQEKDLLLSDECFGKYL